VFEILVTISIAGLVAGWVFSIPGGGPITVLTTANALQGRKHFCLTMAIGGALVNWFWAFVTIFGFSKVFRLDSPILPYLFFAGSIFLVYMGVITSKKRIDLGQFRQRKKISSKRKVFELRKGFITGFTSALLNPSLALSWLGSTFLTMTFLTFLGFTVAGMDDSLKGIREQLSYQGAPEILFELNPESIEAEQIIKQEMIALENTEIEKQGFSAWFILLMAMCYGLFVALGTILWFYPMALLIIKHRAKLKLSTANNFLKVLGGVLCCVGLYLFFLGFKLLI